MCILDSLPGLFPSASSGGKDSYLSPDLAEPPGAADVDGRLALEGCSWYRIAETLACGYAGGNMEGGSGRLARIGSYIIFPGGVAADTGMDGGGAADWVWYSRVRLELGELVVPVRDTPIGGTGDWG